MKWLLLILFISCGKNEEPKALDIGDSDGDQVLNYEETDDDRYIARYENLKSMRGILKIVGQESLSFPFSNEIKADNGLELFVMNKMKIEKSFFYEWSKLNLTISTRPDLSKLQYKIQLSFDSTTDRADEIIFVQGDKKVPLGQWKPFIEFFLSQEDLTSLLNGRSSLQVKKSQHKSKLFDENSEETIRKKTSRLFLYDGKETHTYYISKDLSLEQLLARFKIESASSVEEDELPFGRTTPEKKWFLKIIDDQYILIYSSTDEIKKKFLQNFHSKSATVRRDNGAAGTPYQFENKKIARIYYRIRSIEDTTRNFYESSEVRRYGGKEDKYECRHHFRSIQSEVPGRPNINILLNNLTASFKVDGLTYDSDEAGEYWKAVLFDAPENSAISLISRPANTYTVTGEYYNGCGEYHRNAYYNTNVEGKFSFLIESYVEKI